MVISSPANYFIGGRTSSHLLYQTLRREPPFLPPPITSVTSGFRICISSPPLIYKCCFLDSDWVANYCYIKPRSVIGFGFCVQNGQSWCCTYLEAIGFFFILLSPMSDTVVVALNKIFRLNCLFHTCSTNIKHKFKLAKY